MIAVPSAHGQRAAGRCSPPAAANAAPKPETVANRSAGALASAVMTTRSTSSGTDGRTTRIDRGSSICCRAMIACAVEPVWGGSPASIS